MPMKTFLPILKPMSRYSATRSRVETTFGITTTLSHLRMGFQTISRSG